jgi:hypothetical protein
MDWMNIVEQIFELIVYPLLGVIGVYLTYLLQTKIDEIKQKTTDETVKKYLDMLDSTVQSAVMATTQTYVDSLKAQGKFDMEAQKTAFKLTYDAVMKVLSDEAVKYITIAVGDIESYVANKIEASIKLSKNI